MNSYEFIGCKKLEPAQITEWSRLARLTRLHQERKLETKFHPFIFYNTRHCLGGDFEVSDFLKNLSKLEAYDHCILSDQFPVTFKIRSVKNMKKIAKEVFGYVQSLSEGFTEKMIVIPKGTISGLIYRIVTINCSLYATHPEHRSSLYKKQSVYAAQLLLKTKEVSVRFKKILLTNLIGTPFDDQGFQKYLTAHPVKAYMDIQLHFEKKNISILIKVYHALCALFTGEEKERYLNDKLFLKYLQVYLSLYEENASLFPTEAIYETIEFEVGRKKKKKADTILRLTLLAADLHYLIEEKQAVIGRMSDWKLFKHILVDQDKCYTLHELIGIRCIANDLGLKKYSYELYKEIENRVDLTSAEELILPSLTVQTDLKKVWVKLFEQAHIFLFIKTFTRFHASGEISEEKGFSLRVLQHPTLSIKKQVSQIPSLTELILKNVRELETDLPSLCQEVFALAPNITSTNLRVSARTTARELQSALTSLKAGKIRLTIDAFPPPESFFSPSVYRDLDLPLQIHSEYHISAHLFQGIVSILPVGSELTSRLIISGEADLDALSKNPMIHVHSVGVQSRFGKNQPQRMFNLLFQWLSQQMVLKELEIRCPLYLSEMNCMKWLKLLNNFNQVVVSSLKLDKLSLKKQKEVVEMIDRSRGIRVNSIDLSKQKPLDFQSLKVLKKKNMVIYL